MSVTARVTSRISKPSPIGCAPVSPTRTDRVGKDGTLRLFRACKFGLADVDPLLIEDALRPGRRLVVRVRLTDTRGNPGCSDVAWSVERAP